MLELVLLALRYNAAGGADHETQHPGSRPRLSNRVGCCDARDDSRKSRLDSYGGQFLQLMASVYPGYHATRSIGEVVVGTLYGAVDGFVGGAVFAWSYNHLVPAPEEHPMVLKTAAKG